MLLSSSLRNRKSSAPAAHRQTQSLPRQRIGFRPQVEALEDRRLFSAGGGAIAINLASNTTLSASTNSHGGSSGGGTGGGTFYATAINVTELIADINYVDAAGGTFTVNLQPATTFDLTTVNNTTDGANGLPVVGGAKAVNLTITGNGDTIERATSTAVVHGNKNTSTTSAFRLFDVAQGAALTIDGLTLKGGNAGAGGGGAIYNQGTLIVSSSTLSGNSATNGGGIYNVAGGTVTVENSSAISGNSAGVAGVGADVYNLGTVFKDFSSKIGVLSGNFAILLSDGGSFIATATTVTELIYDINYADAAGGTFTFNLQPDTPFDLISPDNTTIGPSGTPIIGGTKAVNLTIIGNGDTLERVGSSLRFFTLLAGSSLTLEGMTLQGGYGGFGSGTSVGFGGAIFNAGTLTISDSTLNGNSVSGNFSSSTKGGAIYNSGGTVTISNTTLSNNSASWGYGGAIYNASGTVTITNNSLLFGNYVSPAYSGGGGYGGGIYNAGGTVTVENFSSITGNYTLWWDQGAVPLDVYNAGVLYLDHTSVIGASYGGDVILI